MKGYFWAAAVVDVLAIGWLAAEAPARVATHFDTSGVADAYASRTVAVLTAVVVTVVVAATFVGTAAWLRTMPLRLINLPGKGRWVAAGQESRMRSMLADDMSVVGALSLLLLAAADVLVVRANRAGPPHLDEWAWVVIGGYLVLVLAYTAWILAVRYRHPPTTRD